MSQQTEAKSLIQHKVRAEIKRWIEEQAKAQERPQGWIANKIMEEAYAKAQQQGATV